MVNSESIMKSLEHVFYPVSAVISLDGQGSMLGSKLVDTDYGTEYIRVMPGARQVWLLSNHPDGSRMISESDIRNLNRLKKLAGDAPVTLFIGGEDIGCFPAEPPCQSV